MRCDSPNEFHTAHLTWAGAHLLGVMPRWFWRIVPMSRRCP